MAITAFQLSTDCANKRGVVMGLTDMSSPLLLEGVTRLVQKKNG